jgi:hypothetical protein
MTPICKQSFFQPEESIENEVFSEILSEDDDD